jgi:hypothetical protein
MALQTFVGPLTLFQFLDLLHSRGISSSQGLYLYTEQPTDIMPQVGLERKTPLFERAKTVDALECAATVIDINKEQTV